MTSSATQGIIFPQSVASGDPSLDGVVLWTRVDLPSLGIASPSSVAWQIATSNSFEDILLSGTAAVTAATDCTVKVPIRGGLQSFTAYYYRFIYNGVPSRTGRFKTLPHPNSSLPEVRFGFVVCQDYGNGFYTALEHLAAEDVDYVIHLGDYIYETVYSPDFQKNPVRTVPPFPSGSVTIPLDVDDYRHLYKIYRSDLNQQAVHERFAYIQLWDDHEFANDCHRDFHPDDNTAPDTPATPQPALRQAANQAWVEYGLANTPFDSSLPWDESVKVYRTFSFGKLADLIITDERLHRDGPPCGEKGYFGRYFSLGCAELHHPDRTMLGAAQREWFLDQVTGSTATWKLWANEVMLMQLTFADAVYVSLDQWDGYPKERQAMLTTIHNAGVQNFVALTGDLHTFLAGYLRRDFDNIFESPMGIELMVGSISSANVAEDIESAISLPSSPLPGKQFGVEPNLVAPLIEVNNPHIKYWNSSTHGYGIVTLTQAQLTCVFKAVTTIRLPVANLSTLRTFTVPAGSVSLHQS